MTELAPDAGFRGNEKLKGALLQHAALSPAGLSERLFGLLFSGLVYPQIWEDPEIDMEAMELAEGHRIVTIDEAVELVRGGPAAAAPARRWPTPPPEIACRTCAR